MNITCTIRDYMSHLLLRHHRSTSHGLTQKSLEEYFSLTKQNSPGLLWHSQCPILLLLDLENPDLPGIYTTDFWNLVKNVHKIINPYHCHLRPGNLAEGLRKKILESWVADHHLICVWRDTTILELINSFLCRFWTHLTFLCQDIHTKEVGPLHSNIDDEIQCTDCQDGIRHFDPENCVPAHLGRPFINRDFDGFRSFNFQLIAGIWIGLRGDFSEHLPHSVRYKLLNLTNEQEHQRLSTGYVGGRPVVLRDRGQSIIRFDSYFDWVAEVCSQLPQTFHSPIFLQVPYDDWMVDSIDEAFKTVCAFMAQVDSLRKKYLTSFVIICPGPGVDSLSRGRIYREEKIKVQTLGNLISLVAQKSLIPCVPVSGFLHAATEYTTGTYSVTDCFDSFLDEPLYNPSAGTPTREYRKRMGRLVDEICDFYVNVNVQRPFSSIFLRNILCRDKSLYFRGNV
jgi:hypothetical protein